MPKDVNASMELKLLISPKPDFQQIDPLKLMCSSTFEGGMAQAVIWNRYFSLRSKMFECIPKSLEGSPETLICYFRSALYESTGVVEAWWMQGQ